MATAAIAGRIGSLDYGASTSALAEIAEVRNWRVNVTHRAIDATSNDSSGYDEFIQGQRTATITFEAIHVRTDADQIAVRKMMSTSGSKYFRLRPTTAAPTQKWLGQGWLSNYSVGAGSYDQPVLFNAEVQVTGPLTYTT